MKKHSIPLEICDSNQRFSYEKKIKIDYKRSIISKVIKAREEKGLSQRELAEMSGVKQPAIARIENMKNAPQIDTLMKLLVPLGYTLEIVPLREEGRSI